MMANAVSAVLRANPALEAEELDTARRELLRIQRTTLLDLRRDGSISDEVFERLTAEVDAELMSETPAVALSFEGAGGLPGSEAQADRGNREGEAEKQQEKV